MSTDQLQSEVPSIDPFELFDIWFTQARETEPNDPNAMALATATSDARPSVRMVLLKGHGAEGFTFYTNAESRKGEEIRANAQAALLFHWKSLHRQIRIEGPLVEVSGDIADAYFHSRSRDSQLGAVASDQSRPLPERASFVERFKAAEEKFAGGPVERPAHWTGFTVKPIAFEFWLDRPNRLHDRRQFVQTADGWSDSLLFP